ncbi:MAG: hypothetical protein GXP59_00610 [Deltaproteobacteria bacterium]|nr:hypothetical protein [Deltaproteobacteria bacterium]
MSKAEITATEKLLDLIRAESTAPPAESGEVEDLDMGPQAAASPKIVPPVPVIKSAVAEKPPRAAPVLPLPKAARRGLFSRIFKRSAQVNIGIDIQPTAIHLVKFCRKTNEFLDYRTTLFPNSTKRATNTLLSDNDFKATLAGALRKFCRRHRHPEIWCSLGGLRVDFHNITIPIVEEAEIANAVFWSTKKTADFDPQKEIFDFTKLKKIDDHGTARLLTLVTLVPKDDTRALQKLFRNIGFKLTGVSYPPVATQNLLQFYNISSAEDAIVHLRLRRANSFIDIFYRGQMIFSREIKAGAGSFIESCQEYGSNLGLDIDEQTAADLVFGKRGKSGAESGEPDMQEKINTAELPVLERLTRQLNRTFEYCANNFGIAKINTLCTSGEFILNNTILLAIEKELAISCKILPAFGAMAGGRVPKADAGQRYNLNTAAGLALSVPTVTKNFLYTHADSSRDIFINKINQAISLITITAALLIGGLVFQQYQQIYRKKAEVKQLTRQLAESYNREPRTKNSAFILQALKILNNDNLDNKIEIARFKILAGLSELNSIIPAHLHLTSLLIAKSGGKRDRDYDDRADKMGKTKKLWLSGYVDGPAAGQDFVVLNFIKKLSRLNLIRNPILTSKKKGRYLDRNITKFKIFLTVNSVRQLNHK